MQRPTLEKIVYVDHKKCTHCRLCAETLPDVFEMNENEIAEVHNPYAADLDQLEAASEACPGKSILFRKPFK